MRLPTKDEAHQFAIIVSSGVPSIHAIHYFLSDEEARDANVSQAIHDRWLRSREVQSAQAKLMGKPWESMSLMERITYSIDKHYTELAYYLYSHNYSLLTGAEKTKADTARQVLEAKLAGMSGKMDALSLFYADVMSGKIKATPTSFPVPQKVGES